MRRSRRDLRGGAPAGLPPVDRQGGQGGSEADRVRPLSRALAEPRFEMTVAAFLARQRAGALSEGPRAELVAGRSVPAQRLLPAEIAALAALSTAFRRVGLNDLGVDAVSWAPLRLGPIDLVRAALALLPGPAFVRDGHDGTERASRPATEASTGIGGSYEPSDTLLVIESVTAGHHRSARLARYAAAGAREVWLLDVRRGWIESLRSPWRGEYRSRTLWYPGEVVPIAALPSIAVEAMQAP